MWTHGLGVVSEKPHCPYFSGVFGLDSVLAELELSDAAAVAGVGLFFASPSFFAAGGSIGELAPSLGFAAAETSGLVSGASVLPGGSLRFDL